MASTKKQTKLQEIVNKILFNINTNNKTLFGKLYFSPSSYGEKNIAPAGSLGGALRDIYKKKFHNNISDFGCDVLAICGMSTYNIAQSEHGNIQLITFVSVVHCGDNEISTNAHTVFLDKEGNLVLEEVNRLENIIKDNYENREFMFPVYDNNGWGCSWEKINCEQLKIILDELKEFLK